MISHKKKFVFFHIPKCGGSSLISKFKKYRDEEKYKDGHPKLDAIIEMNLKNYFTFTFVRNPYDRLVSAFYYIKNGNTGWYYDKQLKRKLGLRKLNFKDFVKTKLTQDTMSKCHFAPVFGHFVSSDTISKIDFIGRVENLKSDFKIICNKLEISNIDIPHKNKSKHKHYTEYYDDETKEIVAKKYAKDIEYFNYKFGE